jgi:hypothetical protein
MFWFPKLEGPVFGRCTVLKSILVNPVQQLLDAPISKTGGSRFSRSSKNLSKMMMVEPDDWRAPLIRYLENPNNSVVRKVRRQALKYVVLDNDLYRRTIDVCY